MPCPELLKLAILGPSIIRESIQDCICPEVAPYISTFHEPSLRSSMFRPLQRVLIFHRLQICQNLEQVARPKIHSYSDPQAEVASPIAFGKVSVPKPVLTCRPRCRTLRAVAEEMLENSCHPCFSSWERSLLNSPLTTWRPYRDRQGHQPLPRCHPSYSLCYFAPS